jgi:hypothetical protein
MGKGVLVDCVFLARLLDMESGFTSTRRPGLTGKFLFQDYGTKTANLGVVSIPIELVK